MYGAARVIVIRRIQGSDCIYGAKSEGINRPLVFDDLDGRPLEGVPLTVQPTVTS